VGQDGILRPIGNRPAQVATNQWSDNVFFIAFRDPRGHDSTAENTLPPVP
jgi:hypothetical protein